MAIEPACLMCSKQLEKPGALMLGPPINHLSLVSKDHICVKCWDVIIRFIIREKVRRLDNEYR